MVIHLSSIRFFSMEVKAGGVLMCDMCVVVSYWTTVCARRPDCRTACSVRIVAGSSALEGSYSEAVRLVAGAAASC
jgi:hypothetical protein